MFRNWFRKQQKNCITNHVNCRPQSVAYLNFSLNCIDKLGSISCLWRYVTMARFIFAREIDSRWEAVTESSALLVKTIIPLASQPTKWSQLKHVSWSGQHCFRILVLKHPSCSKYCWCFFDCWKWLFLIVFTAWRMRFLLSPTSIHRGTDPLTTGV